MSLFSGQTDAQKAASVKKTIDVEGATRRRHDESISLRKKHREQLIKVARRDGTEAASAHAATTAEHEASTTQQSAPHVHNAGPLDPFAYDVTSNPHTVPVALLPAFAQMAMDPNSTLQLQLHGTMMIRKLLAVDENPPIDEIIASGVVPRLAAFLEYDPCPSLQFEAAWAITNIASGTPAHTHYALSLNVVPSFIRILASPSDDVREQTTWALGNLAGESTECRDYILSLGVLQPLMECIEAPTGKITVTRNSVWALSNLCRTKPLPDLALMAPALPLLASKLNHHDDEVVVDACWALSFISDGPQERVQAVLNQSIMPRVVQLLTSPSAAMIMPAIRIVGNVAAGSDVQTQVVINCGALSAFPFLLTHPKRTIRKETCWTLSNITAGSVDQIQAVINAKLFPIVIKQTYATEFEVKKEAVWTIANATSGGTPEQIRYLVECKALESLCDILTMFDTKLVNVALEALENILEVGEDEKVQRNLPMNPVAQILMDGGGLEKIEALQTHATNDVYGHAMSILEHYFETEESGGAVSGVMPAVTAQQSGYAFGGAPGGAEGGGAGNGFSF